MSSKTTIVIGVDVGGTNTDAVFFEKETKKILGFTKTPTTSDVTSGITEAVKLSKPDNVNMEDVTCMSIGTTAFINAILERSPKLARVAVLRMCGEPQPCTKAILPFETFPKPLRNVVEGYWKFLPGGIMFTGKELSPFSEEAIINECKIIKEKGIKNIVVSSVFSPIDNSQEVRARKVIEKEIPGCTVTISSEVATLGLMERENASILNESLRPLAQYTIKGFQEAFKKLNLNCPFYLTQNDGTLIDAYSAIKYPIFCISSGPTNSARGAHFLTGLKKGIVVDIGGTTTDVGVLVDGFPRQTQVYVSLGGVQTNFRMPDVSSFALGGGSIIRGAFDGDGESSSFTIGPDSVGFRLAEKGTIFGGDVLTTTDVSVVHRMDHTLLENIGLPEKIEELSKKFVGTNKVMEKIVEKIHSICEDGIDLMRTSNEEIPIILVGGGTILISEEYQGRFFKFIKPKHAGVANAIGAAISQVSGTVNVMVSLKKPGTEDEEEQNEYRQKVIDGLKKRVIDLTVKNGADVETVEVVHQEEVDVGYVGALTGQKRVMMKAIGEIKTYIRLEEGNNTSSTSVLEQQNVVMEEEEEEEEEEISRDYKPRFIDGEWRPSLLDIKCISIGAGILGCGGGGNTLMSEIISRKYVGDMTILPYERIPEKDKVVPVAFMGAPSVMGEKIPNGDECIAAVDKLKEIIGSEIGGIIGGEIGGMNGLTPMYVAAMMKKKLYDCDLMGRAFPELQMFTNFIYGDHYNPTCLSNEKGEVVVKNDAQSCKEIEDELRKVVFFDFGGLGGITIPPLTKKEVEAWAIKNTYSESWRIGKAVLLARKEKKQTPVQSILETCKGSKLLYLGKIIELNQQRIEGFDKVVLKMKGITQEFQNKEVLEIIVQNENLIARVGQKIVACVPDLITIVNMDDGAPIQTDVLSYGLRCAVLVMPICDLMKTEKALGVVGPKAFNLGCEYKECGKQIGDHLSVYEEFGEKI